jgi:hypothetical protein
MLYNGAGVFNGNMFKYISMTEQALSVARLTFAAQENQGP